MLPGLPIDQFSMGVYTGAYCFEKCQSSFLAEQDQTRVEELTKFDFVDVVAGRELPILQLIVVILIFCRDASPDQVNDFGDPPIPGDQQRVFHFPNA